MSADPDCTDALYAVQVDIQFIETEGQGWLKGRKKLHQEVMEVDEKGNQARFFFERV